MTPATCDTNGHLFGMGGVCILCGQPSPAPPPVGEDDPWRDVNHYHWNHANEDARPCLNANCCRPHWMDEHQVEAALTLTRQQHAETERTLKSISTMLGWGNVPPRETLERDINALKSRAKKIAEKDREIDVLRRGRDEALNVTEMQDRNNGHSAAFEAAESREAALRAELEQARRDLEEQNGTTHALNLAAEVRKLRQEIETLKQEQGK